MALSDPIETQFKAGCLTQGPELQLCFKGKPAKKVDLETQGTWEGVPCYTQLRDRVPVLQLGTSSPSLCSELDVVLTQMSISGSSRGCTLLTVCPS